MKFVPNAVSVTAARTLLTGSKHSPKALFAVGIVGMGATVVLSCRATLKVEEVLERTEIDLEKIAMVQNTPHEQGAVEYTEMDARKDKTIVYFRAAGDLAKLYAPAVLCGVVSVAALTGSHHILSKRNVALTAAYGALEKTFGEYRDRVAAEYGRDKERDIYRNAEAVTVKNEETGKNEKVKVSRGGTPYSFLFDERNVNWSPNPEYNTLFLKMQQQWANQCLQAKGHVFLNDVLDSLGMDRTPAGAVTGWIKGEGDDFVDFGIFNGEVEERVVDFMIGKEKSIWLDFNVDGTIWDKI